MLQVSKRGEVEKDENRHHLATGHSEFAVPPFLWGTLFQGMTFDYGVVFFQEFVDEIVDLYSLLVGIIVGFALCFQRIKDTNLTLDSHFFLPLFLGRIHVL